MVMAVLRGKLPTEQWQSSEDMLTASVLGSIKNMDVAILNSILSRAISLDGVLNSLTFSGEVNWHFWPRWSGCEPDVVIEDEENLCIIEAKLLSDFGKGEEGTRQLAREWRDGLKATRKSHKTLWLLALTNHGTIPREDIEHQLANVDFEPHHLLWLSWFDVGRVIQSWSDKSLLAWRSDLLELLSRFGLSPFDGFKEFLAKVASLQIGQAAWLSHPFFATTETSGDTSYFEEAKNVIGGTDVELGEGPQLDSFLRQYEVFLAKVYSIMRFIESEVKKRGWSFIENGGHAVDRNGRSRQFSKFDSDDWVTSFMGICFVRPEEDDPKETTKWTTIPPNGLDIVFFQVRWLDKSPGEPTVWYGELHVEPVKGKKAGKWQEYQTKAFRRIEPDPRTASSGHGDIVSFRQNYGNSSQVIVSGHYSSVPLVELVAEADILKRIVNPALKEE
jgi:hypothetical protein